MKRYMQASLLLMGFLLVQSTAAMAQCPIKKAIKTSACTVLYKYKESNGVAIKVREGWDIDKAIAYFKGVKGVLSIGVNGIMQPE